MRITVLGAGAWGTALAACLAARHDSLLWARDAAQAAILSATRRNERYLPGIDLPAALRVEADFDAALAHARAGGEGGLVVVATPMSGLREMLSGAAAANCGIWWLCKGFEAGSGALGHEVARGCPTALVAASADAALREQALEAFHGDALRIYTSADPVGVEVGGAVKNVIAIATGIADGMALGMNARAALITRGLAEMTRLGLALGARADTFMGLSGLGDLVLTATGDLSRNRQVGLQLAKGRALADVLAALGHVAEGVYSAPTVLARAKALGVDMPLTAAVVAVLAGRITAAQALERLMRREARAESETGP